MKKIVFISLVVLAMIFSVACEQEENTNLLLPPEEGGFIESQPSQLIYQNDNSTLYSIGEVGPTFTFYNNSLEVKNSNEEITTYEISYDEKDLTIEDFEKQFQAGSDIPDISSYKNTLQYDLLKATKDSPGYRLYVLDEDYWMGTLYKNDIWRIVHLDIEKESL